MSQLSDLRHKHARASQDLQEEKTRRKDMVEKASKIGQSDWDEQWDAERLARLKTDVKSSKKAVAYVERANSSHVTGRSPLSSPMSDIK